MQTASFSVQNELNGGCEMCVSPAEEITVTVRPRLSGGDCKLAAHYLCLSLLFVWFLPHFFSASVSFQATFIHYATKEMKTRGEKHIYCIFLQPSHTHTHSHTCRAAGD